MFVNVKLIDSQEHQYPNKNLIQRSKEKPEQDPEKPIPIQLGWSKIQRKTEKNQCSWKPYVPESVDQDKQNPESAIQASFEDNLKFVPPDEPCSFLVRFSTNFLTVPEYLRDCFFLYQSVTSNKQEVRKKRAAFAGTPSGLPSFRPDRHLSYGVADFPNLVTCLFFTFCLQVLHSSNSSPTFFK